MTVIGHSGHWVVNLVYILPLVIALSVLGWQKFKGADDDRARPAGRARATPKDADKER